jgi:DNA helicase-2/ATP-dependent DNA helicase PcrA
MSTPSSTPSSALLASLNPDQLAAVTAPGSALVLAGAGSGKTRVLTTRIAWLIQTGQVSPMGLMAVTFTNKAAKEMLTRLTAMLPINTRGMWVGTFHGLCNRLLRAHELLSRNALLREHYQQRFRHILVDEFQDTSRLQYLWLKLLKGPDSALFAVGDDDQSIYAFRGANVGNMALFLDEMAIAAPIKLTRNYRSISTILDAANAVIAHNQDRLGKDLWTDAGQGEQIRHFQANDDGEEARFVVEEIQGLKREGEAYVDMAVLYRSNAQSRSLEHALFSAGIPYRVYGGLRFFERAEIKHALAYLRLAANPEDDNAFLRVVNFPARGVGARSLESLDAEARAAGISLWAAACKAGKKFEPFVRLVD